jgi:uncharacterized membrane protein YphA (DoxX/SURF4 family)
MNRVAVPQLDVGLLVLRVGVAVSSFLLFTLPQTQAANIFTDQPRGWWTLVALSIGAFFVIFGLVTRLATSCLALSWAWAAYSELRMGQHWDGFPVRSILFCFVLVTLALTGPGKFSLSSILQLRKKPGH